MNPHAIVPASTTSSAILQLVPHQAPEVLELRELLEPIIAAGARGRGARIAALAEKTGMPAKTLRKKLDALIHRGVAGLVNRRDHPALWNSTLPAGLPEADKELVKTWCEKWQRSSEAAIRAMRAAWLEQCVPVQAQDRGLEVPLTAQPVDIRTGYPVGWSVENLLRHAPSAYELKAVRIGRSAASAHRPLVYTTRRLLYVGQYVMWDDIWHDHEVVDFDPRRRGRPLEFHGLDLASACKIAWGMRTRTQRADGSHDGLTGGDFRFTFASYHATTGFHPQGTVHVAENGTAAIPEWMERILFDATDGAITVNRAGMTGATAHAGQYAGRAKGNFRFKAALESLGNLMHNEFAALPGQVGKDRDHSPEQMHDAALVSRDGAALRTYGLTRHEDALIAAMAQLAPARAELLLHPLTMMHTFRSIAGEVYARINARRMHDLEGWDDRWVYDERTGKMRRLSPQEVWQPGARALKPLDLATIALMLAGGDGLEKLGIERTTRNGMFEFNDGELSGDLLRYDATALKEREKYLTMLNPFDDHRLFVFGANGGFITAAKRIHSVCRSDEEAVRRRMGEAAKTEAALLQPLRLRHLAEAKQKLERHEHNARVLGRPAPASSLPDAGECDAVNPSPLPDRDPAGDSADDLASELSDLL